MVKVNMHEAKSQLSKLVDAAQNGEEVVVARAGRPVARIVPFAEVSSPVRIGLFAGERFKMAEDFDELPDDIAAAFEGNS